jgi:hypothetical protein
MRCDRVMRYVLGCGNMCERDGLNFDKTCVIKILVTRIGIHSQIGSFPYPLLLQFHKANAS